MKLSRINPFAQNRVIRSNAKDVAVAASKVADALETRRTHVGAKQQHVCAVAPAAPKPAFKPDVSKPPADKIAFLNAYNDMTHAQRQWCKVNMPELAKWYRTAEDTTAYTGVDYPIANGVAQPQNVADYKAAATRMTVDQMHWSLANVKGLVSPPSMQDALNKWRGRPYPTA